MKILNTFTKEFNLNFNTIENGIKTVLFIALTVALLAVTISNIINPQNFTL